jgi:hypothetical protein
MKMMLGGRTFATIGAAKLAVREILNSWPTGSPLTGEADVLVRDLLSRHPEAALKIGCGVESIGIRPVVEQYASRGFWITRTDGSGTDFSYLKCFSPPTRAAEAKEGFRTAVRPQIRDFRDLVFANGLVVCPITGEVLTETTCQVDHEPPLTFEALVKDFLGDIDPAEVDVNPTEDGSTVTRIADPEIEKLWQNYHRTYAKLRVVSIEANLRIIPKIARRRS